MRNKSLCVLFYFLQGAIVRMNLSASKCSSGTGCESGWTLYLDQSSVSKNQNQCYSFGHGNDKEKEDESDDLSMVSDASSGPPHCSEHDEDCFYDENGCFYSPHLASELALQKGKNKKKIKQQQHNSYLNDTASSPVKKNISFSKNATSMEHVLDFSQGFSATHLKEKSTSFKKHFDFLQSSLAGKKAGGLNLKDESGMINDIGRHVRKKKTCI